MEMLELREAERWQPYRDLSVIYEGSSGELPVRPPDLSTHGMFIHVPRELPVGSVLKISFRLQRSGFQVNVRAEVRHCIPGTGLGVEFLDLPDEAARMIEKELLAPGPRR